MPTVGDRTNHSISGSKAVYNFNSNSSSFEAEALLLKVTYCLKIFSGMHAAHLPSHNEDA